MSDKKKSEELVTKLPDFVEVEENDDDIDEVIDEESLNEEDLPPEEQSIENVIKEPKSKYAIVVTSLALIIFVLGLFYILSDKERKEQVAAFFSGEIVKYKMAHKLMIEQKFKKFNRETTPRYGSFTLVYYPQDAKVTIIQIKKKYNSFKDYKEGKVASTEKKEIDNPSLHLKEKEIIKELPLKNLPILTREFKGGIKEKDTLTLTPKELENLDAYIYTYEYIIKIEKEGYKPREFHIKESTWENIGPGVYTVTMFQNGINLEPNPETVKKNFLNYLKEMHCIQKYVKDKKKLFELDKEMQVRYGFQTTKEFETIQAQLQQDTEWWQKALKEVAKHKCTPPNKK